MPDGAAAAAVMERSLAFDHFGERNLVDHLARGRPVEVLSSLGMEFALGHDPAHVESVAAVVVTSAVPADHPELQAARARGIPVLTRSVAPGQWVNEGRVVGIAGTHGKSTTTAMATHVLEHAGVDPTGVVGGEVRGWGGNLRPGGSDVFVVEADEYDRSFLDLDPGVAVVTNVEADHLDVYGDLAGVRTSFSDFIGRLDPAGTLWVCGDDPGAARIGVAGGDRTRSYGLGAGVSLRGSLVRDNGVESVFHVIEDGVSAGDMTVPLPGLHNVRNAVGAAAMAHAFGADMAAIRAGLEAVRPVAMRMQVERWNGIGIINDAYNANPASMEAALAALKAIPGRGRRVAALGDMREMGAHEAACHREVGEAAAASGLDALYLLGRFARDMRQGALAAGMQRTSVHVARSHRKLGSALRAELRKGDWVLVKGSRGAAMEKVLAAMKDGGA